MQHRLQSKSRKKKHASGGRYLERSNSYSEFYFIWNHTGHAFSLEANYRAISRMSLLGEAHSGFRLWVFYGDWSHPAMLPLTANKTQDLRYETRCTSAIWISCQANWQAGMALYIAPAVHCTSWIICLPKEYLEDHTPAGWPRVCHGSRLLGDVRI